MFLEGKQIVPLISEEKIIDKVKQLAAILDEEYKDKDLVLLVVIKGALFFAIDLMRAMKKQCVLACIRSSSYTGTSQGVLTVQEIEAISLSGKHVVIIDDILDTGKTLEAIKARVARQHPASIKIAVLLKKNRSTPAACHVDWFGIAIDDLFVIGYGLDYHEHYRNLSAIYHIQSIPVA